MYAERVCVCVCVCVCVWKHSVMSVSMLQWRPAKWSRTDAEHGSGAPSHSQEKRLC